MKLYFSVKLAIACFTLSLASLFYSAIPVQAKTLATPNSESNQSTRLGILTIISQPQQSGSNLSQYLNQLTNSCSQNSFSPGSSQNPNLVSTPEPATIVGLALAVVLGLGLQRKQAKP